MITVLDYGAGNLRSVENTLGALGAEYQLTRTAEDLSRAEKIILPGVGHVGQMMHALDAMAVRDTLIRRVREGVPFLGICLGMQALFERSEEATDVQGFAIFPGVVKRFAADARVPHMGWNEIAPRPDSRLLRNAGAKPYLYFAHSYYCPVIDATAATCDYTLQYTAAIEQDNIFGVQFHPEKSGPLGLKIVGNFAAL